MKKAGQARDAAQRPLLWPSSRCLLPRRENENQSHENSQTGDVMAAAEQAIECAVLVTLVAFKSALIFAL